MCWKRSFVARFIRVGIQNDVISKCTALTILQADAHLPINFAGRKENTSVSSRAMHLLATHSTHTHCRQTGPKNTGDIVFCLYRLLSVHARACYVTRHLSIACFLRLIPWSLWQVQTIGWREFIALFWSLRSNCQRLVVLHCKPKIYFGRWLNGTNGLRGISL